MNNTLRFIFLVFFNLLICPTISAKTAVPTIDLTNLKWGLKDSASNKVILGPKYDYITRFQKGIAFVSLNDKYGFISEDGYELAAPIYDNYSWVNDSLIKLKRDNLFALYTPEMKEVMPFIFESLSVYGEYLLVNNGEKSGVIDLDGDIIIPFIYDDIYLEYSLSPKRNGRTLRIRVTLANKMGTIDIENEIIIPIIYDGINFESNDFIYAVNEGSCGLLSSSGGIIIPLNKYDFLEISDEYPIAVGIKGAFGYIDYTGKSLIPLIYEDARSFMHKMGAVQKGGIWGAINYQNEIVLPFEYESPLFFVNGFSRLEKRLNDTSKYAYINSNGTIITNFIFDEVENYRKHIAKVRIGEKWGVLDTLGNEVIPINYDEISIKKEYIIVMNNYKQGLYSQDGTLILRSEYSFIYPPSDHELIMVRNGAKYGYVNHSGEIIIPIIYENARSFAYGRATVLLDGVSFEINELGESL